MKTTATVLALDSASQVCGVSLLCAQSEQAQPIVYTVEHHGSTQHAERMLPLVEQVLAEAKITTDRISSIAFAQGPGSFTGLRVACGVAQGLAYAWGVRVAPVCSLQAIAAQQTPIKGVDRTAVIELVLVDARMHELYVGAYQRTATGWYRFHKPILISQSQLTVYIQRLQQQQKEFGLATTIRASGDALSAFDGLAAKLTAQGLVLGDTGLARSETIAQLGRLAQQQQQLIEPELAAPIYVRNHVAYTIAERDTGLGGNPSASWQSISIRPMQTNDVAAVAALESQLHASPWSATQLQNSLDAGKWGWVATFNQAVVAYAMLMPAADECELLLIGVAAAHQRQGIAQQLLSHAEQYARAQGCVAMHLEVRVSNTAATALYQGAGYAVVGLRKGYYTQPKPENAALYTKLL